MDLSVIIAARNEEFLQNTIDSVLKNMRADTEIIVILDGYWPEKGIKIHPKVTVVHHEESIGQRAAVNEGARISEAKYIMKLDAHCAVDKAFDLKLMKDCEYDWTVIPRMYNLWAFDWKCRKCGKRTYQAEGKPDKCEDCGSTDKFKKKIVWKAKKNPTSDFMRFDSNMKFQYWREYKDRPEAQGDICDLMSAIGACFFMHRERFWDLGGMDEEHGSWGQFGTEISVKSFTSGGRHVVNRTVAFAHMFRTSSAKGFGFPYKISGKQVGRARERSKHLWLGNNWDKQIYPLSMMIEKYWPIPDWTDEDLKNLKTSEMESTRSGVYRIKNNKNGKVYIGSAANFSRRFSEHLRMLKRNDHENNHLQRSWDKYGEENFSLDILMFCEEKNLLEHEQVFIDECKKDLGWRMMFNMNPSASSRLGGVVTEETKAKMSESKQGENNSFYGKKHSEESKEKMRQSSLGQKAWNKGIPHTEETKAKIGNANSGRVVSEETRKKLSDASRGRIFSEESKAKLRENHVGFKGQHHSDETKAKLSEIFKNKQFSDETRKKISQGVKDYWATKRKENISDESDILPATSDVQTDTLTKGIVYYTNNQCEERILSIVRNQLERCANPNGSKFNEYPIVSISQYPIDFGYNIVMPLKSSPLSMFKQILRGIEESKSDILFFVEHDVVYHPSHFDFIPPDKDKFYYNQNTWKVDAMTGQALFFYTQQVSGLCAYREVLLKHYKARVAKVEKEGFNRYIGFEPGNRPPPRGVDNYKSESWMAEHPNIDIRH
ncbi:MAG: glycosyltransferase, partial [Proteobacteria bacterium]|nr:glycosyltransferase [Pseudomonadota bacterium]